MKILHTADWHLADRLGRIDRTDDLCRAVERIADLCLAAEVDVLVAAGDLFSDRARPEALQETMRHLNEIFRPFLTAGGTIVAITGNHDNEIFCRTLQEAFRMASPARTRVGDVLASGRLHLATGPTHFRLADRAGQHVQFVCLPYPTGQRYLDESRQRFTGADERHRALRDALEERLTQMQQQLDPRLPSLLTAHLCVAGTAVRGLFRLSEQEDVMFTEQSLASGWSYVALGHIHQPHAVAGMPHVRYSGSIERLDQGEREDDKSAVLLEIGPAGVIDQPELVPIDATPFYDVQITDPQAELPQLLDRYPQAERALARIDVTYRAGEDNIAEIRKTLDRLFPRWYARSDRSFQPAGAAANGGASMTDTDLSRPSDTIRRYLEQTLPQDDPDRQDLLSLAQDLLHQAP